MSENQATEGQAPAVTDSSVAGDAAPSAEVEALKQQLAAAQAAVSKANDEAAGRRIKERDARETANTALAEQGQFKALADAQAITLTENAERIATLEGLKDKAAAFDAWEAAELASIEERAAALPPEAQAALAAAPSLAAKSAFLNALSTVRPSATAARDAGAAAAPSGGKATDFSALRGAALSQAIKDDPAGYWSSQGVGTSPSIGSSLGRMLKPAPKG